MQETSLFKLFVLLFFNANSVPCFVLLGEIPWVEEPCVSLETPQCPAG